MNQNQANRLKNRLIKAVIDCPNKDICKLVREGKLKLNDDGKVINTKNS